MAGCSDFIVRQLTESEIPQHVALTRRTFKESAEPLNSLLYIHGTHPDLVAHLTYEALKEFQAAPPNRFWIGAFALTANAQPTMLATALWVLEDGDCDPAEPEEPRKPPPGSHAQFYSMLHAQISSSMKPRMAKLSPRRAYWHLEILTTAPEHYRRGAGRALLDWGLDRADKAGQLVYLDSTAAGRPLYATAGFTGLGELVMDGRQFGSATCRALYPMARGVGGKPIEDAEVSQFEDAEAVQAKGV